MSATERLRELLDERGIAWWSKPRLVVGCVEKGTEFDAADGSWVHAIEALDGTICVSHLTPGQAIAATLGAGTCRDIALEGEWFKCSECRTVNRLIHPNYCPNCGRNVVYE